MLQIEVFTLTDGGQQADDVALRVAAFLKPARDDDLLVGACRPTL
jgi:hypothetical protein